MKLIKIISVLLFAAIIMTPLVFFNTESNSVSFIDNRKLTENPFTLEGDLTDNIQNYINDRIGFRDKLISTYIYFNDKIFNKMVHPSYCYGKDGYVFGAGLTAYNGFDDFHIAFADMIAEIQTYCVERDVPFLFVFNPAKPAVYQDKIADGINYNREWVSLFIEELEKRNINYLDNTEVFKALRENGVDCFNQKYDANHWNDLGAFYGTNAILEQLKKDFPHIHINKLEEFSVSETQKTSLLVSNFPIDEYVPSISWDTAPENLTKEYSSELQLNPAFRGFGYYLNNSDSVKETPKTLVFQGSYMNGFGYKFLANAFEEYIYVHDYQNVLDFPYYFNIFQPECVVFEVAEYTFANYYFNYEKMKSLDYNPPLSMLDENAYKAIDIAAEELTIEKGDLLTKIIWNTTQEYPYVWLMLDKGYDMKKTEQGYEVTVENTRYESFDQNIRLFGATP